MTRAYDEIESDPTYRAGYRWKNKGIETKEEEHMVDEERIMGQEQEHPTLFSVGAKFFVKVWTYLENIKPR